MKKHNRKRYRQIKKIILKYKLTKGVTPEKIRKITEELGPTFIKIGQVMSTREDLLPIEYCQELSKLKENVLPLDFNIIQEIIVQELGENISQIFTFIDEKPLGSASIGQVHQAILTTGEEVVIKVMRPGIYDIVTQDVEILKSVIKYLKIIPSVSNMIDLNTVLTEIWEVMKVEMNFLHEREHLELMAELYQDVKYIGFPRVYSNLTTEHVLVMEYIDGCKIDDLKYLKHHGYDLKDICSKLVENYMTQIIENGIFHADPHSGNIMVSGGKIVWLDLGMLGHISKREQNLYKKAIKAIIRGDVYTIKNVLLVMGAVKNEINHAKLYQDLEFVINKYINMGIDEMDMEMIFSDFIRVARTHSILMPKGMTMLLRSLLTIQKVVADLDSEASLIDFFKNHTKDNLVDELNPKDITIKYAKKIYTSATKSLDIPAQISDLLNLTIKGEKNTNIEIRNIKALNNAKSKAATKITFALLMGAFIIAIAIVMAALIMTESLAYRIIGIILCSIGLLSYLLMFLSLMIMLYKDLKDK